MKEAAAQIETAETALAEAQSTLAQRETEGQEQAATIKSLTAEAEGLTAALDGSNRQLAEVRFNSILIQFQFNLNSISSSYL